MASSAGFRVTAPGQSKSLGVINFTLTATCCQLLGAAQAVSMGMCSQLMSD